MKIFGDASEFAIEYGHITEFFPNPYKGFSDIDDEFDYWVKFWLKGKNIFAFNPVEGAIGTYLYDLNLLVEFFCQSLKFHLIWDPVPAKGIHCSNHYDANILVGLATFLDKEDFDDINEEDNDFLQPVTFNLRDIEPEDVQAQIKWEQRHRLITARQGSFLPDVVIARDYTDTTKVEICYQSLGVIYTDHLGNKFEFTHPTGLAKIDIKCYKEVIVQFCLDFINSHKGRHAKRMTEYLESLKMGIDTPV